MNRNNFSDEALKATYRPVSAQQVLTKTYQPQGGAQVPVSVPNLVSGVSPAAQSGGSQQTAPAPQPALLPANGGQNGGN
jgi:hypothetical protein